MSDHQHRQRPSKHYACSNNRKETVSRYSREDINNIEPLPLLPSTSSSRSRRHSSSSQTSSSSSHERRVVVESDEMLSPNNICHWIQTATQKAKAFDDLKLDYDELKDRHDQLQADFQQQSSQTHQLDFCNRQLKEENARCRQEINELQKRARGQTNKNAPLHKNLKRTQAKLKVSEDELRKKREEKNKLLDEIKKLNTKQTVMSSNNQRYEVRERKMKADVKKLSSEFEKEKNEKDQLQVQLGLKNEEIIKLKETNEKLDKKVHRVVEFVKDDIVRENQKMLMMLIATQQGTVNAMDDFMKKYNEEMGNEKNSVEDWGKLQVPHSKLTEELASKVIMPQKGNNEVIKSTRCDDGDVASGSGSAKRGAEDGGDGNQGSGDSTPLKRSRISLSTQIYDDDGERLERGEEEQQTSTTSEQQYELPVGANISVEDRDMGNGFHEYISSPSDSDFATASATSSSPSEDETTRFITSIKKEPADVPEDSNSAPNAISNSYISSGLRSWSD